MVQSKKKSGSRRGGKPVSGKKQDTPITTKEVVADKEVIPEVERDKAPIYTMPPMTPSKIVEVKPKFIAARCPTCGQMYPLDQAGRTAVCYLNCSQKVTFQGV